MHTLKAIGKYLRRTARRRHRTIKSAIILVPHTPLRIINLHALDAPRSKTLATPTALETALATQRVAAGHAAPSCCLGRGRCGAVQTRAFELLHGGTRAVDVVAGRVGVGGAGGAVAGVGEGGGVGCFAGERRAI